MDETRTYLSGSFLLISSLLGFVAGCKQMLIWHKHLKSSGERRQPSSHPNVVFFLAFGNTLACSSLLLLGIGVFLLHRFQEKHKHGVSIGTYSMIAWIIPIEVLMTFGFVLSACFTVIYLVDVCLQVHHKRSFVMIYHIFAWSASFILLTIILVFRYNHGDLRDCRTHKEVIPLVICWLSLLLSLMTIAAVALTCFDRQVKADLYRLGNSYTRHQRGLLLRIRVKFALLVSIFIVCWTPTIIMGFISTLGNGNGFSEVLSFLEITLNPLQASLNYFIFIPWSHSKSVVPPPSERGALGVTNIQEVFGASIASSLIGSIRICSPRPERTFSTSTHFHFTPCPVEDEEEPLLPGHISDRSDSFAGTTDSDIEDGSLVIGMLLGE